MIQPHPEWCECDECDEDCIDTISEEEYDEMYRLGPINGTRATTYVGTCDWGDCDGETVALRVWQDGYIAVCQLHMD